jgi:arginase family enzyme
MDAVSNPEPGGLSPAELFSLFGTLIDNEVVGFDIVELSPSAHWSPSYHLAAKTLFELMCAVSKDPDVKIEDEIFYWERES